MEGGCNRANILQYVPELGEHLQPLQSFETVLALVCCLSSLKQSAKRNMSTREHRAMCLVVPYKTTVISVV